jgi:hypothetical protein
VWSTFPIRIRSPAGDVWPQQVVIEPNCWPSRQSSIVVLVQRATYWCQAGSSRIQAEERIVPP